MRRVCLAFGVAVLLACCGAVRAQPALINDAQTAIAHARPVFGQMDAASGIRTAEPLSATKDGDVWTVKGPSHCGPLDTFPEACRGNVVKLSAKDGTVLYVSHEGQPIKN